jgi:hypothetical protein
MKHRKIQTRGKITGTRAGLIPAINSGINRGVGGSQNATNEANEQTLATATMLGRRAHEKTRHAARPGFTRFSHNIEFFIRNVS